MHSNTSDNTHQPGAHTEQPKVQIETQIETQIEAKTDAPSNPIPDLKLKDFKWVPVLLVCYYLLGYLLFVLSKPLLPLGENGEGFIPVAGLLLILILPGLLALFYFRKGTTVKHLLFLIFVGVPLIAFTVIAVAGLAYELLPRSFFGILIWPLINLALFGPLLVFRVDKAVGSNPSFLFVFSHLIILLLIFLLSVFFYAMHQPGDS